MESREKEVEGTVVQTIALSGLGTNNALENGNVEKPRRQLKDLDDLFPYIGDFGWYQIMLFLLMIPYAAFFAFVYFAQIFMVLVPEQHWCAVPELFQAGLDVELRRHLSIPLTSEGQFDKCQVYDVNWTEVLQNGVGDPNTKWPTKKCAGKWEFNFTDVPYETIATELGWVCEKDNYGATAQSIFFCGAILGGLIFGWIADKYGRIPALLGSNMVGCFAGVGTAFSNSFWSFCVSRFFVGMAFDNCFIIMYIIVVEYVGPKWRTFVANMSIAVYFTIVASVLPFIALSSADWRQYALFTSAPIALAVFTPWLVPESARWLISQGRIDDALNVLKRCERFNNKKIPDEIVQEFKQTAIEIAEAEKECKKYSVLDLFKTPRLRLHSILLLLIWVSIAMVFDGHVRNVGSLGLDVFVTFSVATATEFPADVLLIIILDTVGRRWLSFSSMVVSGIFSLAAAAVPVGIESATLAIIGRFAVNISYNIGMQYAAELLPTVVRAQGLAFIHISGYIATILVPYIVYLATIATYIPLIILGALGIFGGCLCLFLPESTGKEMPQTIQDGEDFGRKEKFWSFPGWKK